MPHYDYNSSVYLVYLNNYSGVCARVCSYKEKCERFQFYIWTNCTFRCLRMPLPIFNILDNLLRWRSSKINGFWLRFVSFQMPSDAIHCQNNVCVLCLVTKCATYETPAFYFLWPDILVARQPTTNTPNSNKTLFGSNIPAITRCGKINTNANITCMHIHSNMGAMQL